jgi:hypothetical protein
MKNEKEITPFIITCSIQSFSHNLNKKAFQSLMTDETDITVSKVKKRSFLLHCVNRSSGCKTIEKFSVIAHISFSNFLMALNIATLGHFTWNWGASPSLFYQCFDPGKAKGRSIISLQRMRREESDIRDISETQVNNAKLLFIALSFERESNVRKEYIKGILHLSLDLFDIDFNREAFVNFYRSFESLATKRILNVDKLKNELKELQRAIGKYDTKGKIAEEFAYLYRLRSTQIMHSQKKQLNIKLEDVLKMKVVLDFILHKIYQPEWEKVMRNLRENKSANMEKKIDN